MFALIKHTDFSVIIKNECSKKCLQYGCSTLSPVLTPAQFLKLLQVAAEPRTGLYNAWVVGKVLEPNAQLLGKFQLIVEDKPVFAVLYQLVQTVWEKEYDCS